ncbi:Multidrug DMT transporter permease [Vibrio crassostreae]|nr:Multidrug DMT transporter permease [Vibrio crassostreae]CAK1784514.1 Multidrug DMT transporter permease [Vibrio crassostreae]CAK1834904.1 Multidrug DMT transporter permease [Vibrio crassostreae]CAK2274919.1 Multidrug DMT transporter permease [Vibrio crassostreae]CAK2649738.1 Multidrug DMT transporter permease [Vibrio crassostreae]
MDTLRLLIARLGWPCASTRWWTMQALSAYLGNSTTKSETERLLVERLCSCKLEAEVVEILYIFWMSQQEHDYSPIENLIKNVPKPSLLSDMLLEVLVGQCPQDDSDLKLFPNDFDVPDDFNGIQGFDVPRIFRTTMNRLEEHYRFPFVRQMAFEWSKNATVYPEAPYQGDLEYFVRPLGDGFIGSLSSRSSLRAVSSYLRTLAVAKKFWGAPSNLIGKNLLMALPLNPTLAFMKPNRPKWFPNKTDFDGDYDSMSSSVSAMLARVEAAAPGNELIAFASPIMMSMERCVEVSLVRWSQIEGSQVDDDNLAEYISTYLSDSVLISTRTETPLSTKTVLSPPTFQQLIDPKCKAWPLAGTLDFSRIGYLQHDLYPSRLFIPTLPNLFEAELIPKRDKLDIEVDFQVVADLSYWNAAWGPARHMKFGGGCGTALISREQEYRKTSSSKEKPVRQFYFWQVRTLKRERSYEDFHESLETGILFV